MEGWKIRLQQINQYNCPEPSLEPEEPGMSDYCPICGAKLNLFDPYPLCGVCAMMEDRYEQD